MQIPDAEFVASYVYGILAACVAIGLFGTGKTLITFHSILKKPLASPVTMTNPKATPLDFDVILSRNIFNIDGTIPDSASQHQMACPATSTKSSLSYRVIGIIFGGTAKGSVVLLEGNDKKSYVYKLNDTLPSGGKITDITADKVFVSNNSCPEYLAMEYPSPKNVRSPRGNKGSSNVAYSENGFERTGTSTQVTKSWVENILKNKLSSTLQDARAIPNLVNGQIKGFAITQIVPDSVYAKLGLQDGDVVSSINGIELNDAGRAIQTLNSLRNETHIELQVLRNGQPTQFSVNIQ